MLFWSCHLCDSPRIVGIILVRRLARLVTSEKLAAFAYTARVIVTLAKSIVSTKVWIAISKGQCLL